MDAWKRICGGDSTLYTINRNMIVIKIMFLLTNAGKIVVKISGGKCEEQVNFKTVLIFFKALMMPLGFFNLQAVNIGLNVGDVGVVSILVTVFSLTLNPVIGKKN